MLANQDNNYCLVIIYIYFSRIEYNYTKYIIIVSKTRVIIQQNGKPFDHQMGGVFNLIDLIISTDFNQLSIDLKFINFRISANSQL